MNDSQNFKEETFSSLKKYMDEFNYIDENTWNKLFSANLGLISLHTLSLNLLSVPIIILGAFIGVKFLKKIDMNIFSLLIKISAFFVSIKLIFF